MISTHILDLSTGQPAANVNVALESQTGTEWKVLAKTTTNSDGRIQFDNPPVAGTYRLNFNIEEYYKKQNITAFFIVAPVTFKITDTQRKYHIPLLLNQFGYSTYRGS